jgi:putative DNA primase/helicase
MTFIEFAYSNGVEISPDKLYASDRIRRTGTVDKPKSTNGAFFWDGQKGWVYNWAVDTKVNWYSPDKKREWTDAEKQEWVRKKWEKEKEIRESQDNVSQIAEDNLSQAREVVHDYMRSKGFERASLVIGDMMVIPMYCVNSNRLLGYQQIRWDEESQSFTKKMLFGMRAKGAVHFLGQKNNPEIWLVEGYATGLSLHDALRKAGISASVCVCFSANNLRIVAPMLKGAKYVFADNDASGTGERIAKDTSLPYTMADEVGWDANDLAMKSGIYAVIKKIASIRKP